MGCATSNYDVVEVMGMSGVVEASRTFLLQPDDIMTLWKKFKTVPPHPHADTCIDSQGFATMFVHAASSPFLGQLWLNTGLQPDAPMPFAVFVNVVCSFALMTYEEMEIFGKATFRRAGPKLLTLKDIKKQFDSIATGIPIFIPNTVYRAVVEMDEDMDGDVSMDEFRQKANRFGPHFLWLPLELQYVMREETFGLNWWTEQQKMIAEANSQLLRGDDDDGGKSETNVSNGGGANTGMPSSSGEDLGHTDSDSSYGAISSRSKSDSGHGIGGKSTKTTSEDAVSTPSDDDGDPTADNLPNSVPLTKKQQPQSGDGETKNKNTRNDKKKGKKKDCDGGGGFQVVVEDADSSVSVRSGRELKSALKKESSYSDVGTPSGADRWRPRHLRDSKVGIHLIPGSSKSLLQVPSQSSLRSLGTASSGDEGGSLSGRSRDGQLQKQKSVGFQINGEKQYPGQDASSKNKKQGKVGAGRRQRGGGGDEKRFRRRRSDSSSDDSSSDYGGGGGRNRRRRGTGAGRSTSSASQRYESGGSRSSKGRKKKFTSSSSRRRPR